jgi:hypothetical protein
VTEEGAEALSSSLEEDVEEAEVAIERVGLELESVGAVEVEAGTEGNGGDNAGGIAEPVEQPSDGGADEVGSE